MAFKCDCKVVESKIEYCKLHSIAHSMYYVLNYLIEDDEKHRGDISRVIIAEAKELVAQVEKED